MREILFRGKCGNKWHYGDLYTQSNTPQIIAYNKKYDKMDTAFVDPETVGQYTGLRDCKRTAEYPEGQMIFEGDIVLELDGGMDGIPRKVLWDEDCMEFKCPLVKNHWAYGDNACPLWMTQSGSVEIIGNIHDNPELLKEGGEE